MKNATSRIKALLRQVFFIASNRIDWRSVGIFLVLSLFVLSLHYCISSQPTRMRVTDTIVQRQDVQKAIDMIDGLDDSAMPGALEYIQTVVRGELVSCQHTLKNMEQQQRICAINLDDADQLNTKLLQDNRDLQIKLQGNSWLSRFGLRVEWFVYGLVVGIILVIAGFIITKITGFAAKIGAAMGGIR